MCLTGRVSVEGRDDPRIIIHQNQLRALLDVNYTMNELDPLLL